jgi:hypothetical protein
MNYDALNHMINPIKPTSQSSSESTLGRQPTCDTPWLPGLVVCRHVVMDPHISTSSIASCFPQNTLQSVEDNPLGLLWVLRIPRRRLRSY